MNPLLNRLSGLYSHLENRSLSVYWRARAPHILRLLSPGPDDVVLELGCGPGLWTSYITPKVGFLASLDLDMWAIEAARLWKSPRKPCFPTANTGFTQATAERLPFKDGSFSKVLAVDMIEHVSNDETAIREIARVLDVGGRVVMTTLLADRPSYFRKVVFDDHVREYSLGSFEALFMKADLRVEQLFFFYRAPSMIARELQTVVGQTGLGAIPGLALIPGLFFRLLADLELVLPVGRPGGIGVLAVKPNSGVGHSSH